MKCIWLIFEWMSLNDSLLFRRCLSFPPLSSWRHAFAWVLSTAHVIWVAGRLSSDPSSHFRRIGLFALHSLRGRMQSWFLISICNLEVIFLRYAVMIHYNFVRICGVDIEVCTYGSFVRWSCLIFVLFACDCDMFVVDFSLSAVTPRVTIRSFIRMHKYVHTHYGRAWCVQSEVIGYSKGKAFSKTTS